MTSSQDPHIRSSRSPITAGLDVDPPRQAPTAGSDLHPGPLLRRGWSLIVATTAVVCLVLLPLMPLLPSSSTARIEVVITGPEADPVFGTSAGPTPQEQIQRLVVDLESPNTTATAAERAGVAVDDVSVQAVTERDALVAEVAITAPTDAAALQIAADLPALVAEERRTNITQRSAEVATELRDQADATLESAGELETEMAAEEPPVSPPQEFLLRQQRDGLISQYERLLTRAAEIELEAPTRSAGFAVSAAPVLAPGGFPPPVAESTALVILVGVVAGVGLVISRPILGARLQREHFPATTDGRHLGLVRLRSRGGTDDGIAHAAARLRGLSELREPHGRLVSVLALGLSAEAAWTTSAALGSALAESGMDVAVLSIAYEHDATPIHQRDLQRSGAMLIDVDELSTTTSTNGRCQLLRARRFGGSALAAVYSPAMRATIVRHRSGHELLLVDPSASGLEGWLEGMHGPDLVVVLIGENVATRPSYEDARTRLAQAGVPTVSLIVDAPARIRHLLNRHPDITAVKETRSALPAPQQRPTADVS